MFTQSSTTRGFTLYEFTDHYNHTCSVQESSLATQPAIWLWLEEASPKILHGDATKLGILHNKNCGWVDYPIPKEVSLNTRMHLTRAQAADLGSYYFTLLIQEN